MMKRKKFHTLLIRKTTIIKSLIFAFIAAFLCFFAKSIAPPHLNQNQLSTFADLSFTLQFPSDKIRFSSFKLDFLTRTVVKAAGFEIFMPSNFEKADTPPPITVTVPISETTAAPSPTPTYNTSSIEEKTLYGKYGSVSVDNKTSFSPNTDALLNAPVSFSNNSGNPLVLIVHTHSTESYTPSENYNYTPESNSRTTDKNYNIIRVGDEFENTLKSAGINVIHDKSLNDYPSYNGSYTKTLNVIEDYLKKYPSIQIVLDIHRDSMTAADGTKYKLTTEIDGKKVAQLMIVCGTCQGGLTHPDWQENLKLALKFQSKLNSDYNKIARPLSIRKERFNTHATKGSMIIEVGTDANTLDEAVACASYAAKSIASVIKDLSV